MRLLTGTASWTDPTLLACGRFYPPEARSAEARLRFYASRFPMAEIDSSYYAMPSAENAYLWDQRTPEEFVFNIKAFRLFTGHQTPLSALPADIRRELPDWPEPVIYHDRMPPDLRDELWRRFQLALEPLRLPGKLGAVHFQFPPWIRRDARGMARVADCARRMEEHLVSVEFRHRSWFDTPAATADTLAFERELGVAHTVVDSPQGYPNTVPAVWECTHPDLTLLRLHGRNEAAWNASGAASSGRFQYEYTEQELAELAERFTRLAAQSAQAHAVFNTNFEDQGMRNAAAFAAALGPAPGSVSVNRP
ncbi:DUF72 domain-containing protein [Achromobacter denitrificans]|uniref:DUF72 domain-containing protein n=1 Tax=Achromobacter denitrificans TaxID=32002 RepID=UPI00240E5C96|nr:DUF72 domain-containing protein [Achromobacter denitrificans]MBV2159247.1 DUF72 domain-containing protein [Achromobacter denitrificans]MDX3879858.1 DUF72 domain-containing protein [Achromobacter sp.]WFC69983.1 DUF72 domain-containing protein [Achromobacter denitrificans]